MQGTNVLIDECVCVRVHVCVCVCGGVGAHATTVNIIMMLPSIRGRFLLAQFGRVWELFLRQNQQSGMRYQTGGHHCSGCTAE